MERRHGIGMLGRRRGDPRWSDDLLMRINMNCCYTEQKVDSPLEGSLTEVGAYMGDGNNSFITISDRA